MHDARLSLGTTGRTLFCIQRKRKGRMEWTDSGVCMHGHPMKNPREMQHLFAYSNNPLHVPGREALPRSP